MSSYRANAADMDQDSNFAKVSHLQQKDLPDLRNAAIPYFTPEGFDTKLLRCGMGDYHFKLTDMTHRERLKLVSPYTSTFTLQKTDTNACTVPGNHEAMRIRRNRS